MKRIREIPETTQGLAGYLESVDRWSWDEFKSHDSGGAMRELREVLTRNQHGLCAYCEAEVSAGPGQKQIEHVVPQADPMYGAARALDIANLVISCLGGSRVAADDSLRPGRSGLSCGQAKQDRWDGDFVDPRTLPSLPSLLLVDRAGRIVVDSNACRQAGVLSDRVSQTIELLHLNAERLCLARERRWTDLVVWSSRVHADRIKVWIRAVLIPDENDRLSEFFTTSRSYFAPVSEQILAEPPQEWI